MKVKVLVGVVVLASAVICANAQVTVNWWNQETFPGSGIFMPTIDPISGLPVMSSIADPSAGALFQLIQLTSGGAPMAPLLEFGTGTGVASNGIFYAFAWAGKDDYGDGLIYEAASNYVGTRTFAVRMWDRPTSGAGNMPNAFDYGGGVVGAYYYDSITVESFTGVGGSPSLSDFDFAVAAQGSWTFLAVPEPGSMVLGLVGLGVILVRRRLMRK